MTHFVILATLFLIATPSMLHAGDTDKSMFRILGFVSEYGGRIINSTGTSAENHVETFYPHEISVADSFEQALRNYADSAGHPYNVKRAKLEGGHIDFEDSWFSSEINKHYVAIGKATGYGTIDRQFILTGQPENIMEYLAAGYSRYGANGKNSMYFANADEKALTVALALEKQGSTNVVIYKSRFELVPTSFRVDFDPTPEQRVRFKMTEGKTEANKDFLLWKNINKKIVGKALEKRR